MNNSDKVSTNWLDWAIQRYALALSALEDAAPNPSLEQVLEVLKARDAVKTARGDDTHASGESLAKLIELDNRLKKQGKTIAAQNRLANCRQSLEAPKAAWWWFLDAPPSSHQSQPKWARFNWFWNTLTVACLVGATAFTVETGKIFSRNGFDLWQTLTTLSQGTALALVAGGTLTQKGQNAVKNTLASVKISPHLHAETTFVASAALLGISYGIYMYLPEAGEWYYQQATLDYNRGELLKAKEKYEEAMHLAPEQPKTHVALGQIYETLGQLDAAESQYEIGLLKNDPFSYYGLGRVTLERAENRESPKKAAGYFRRALQKENLPESLQAQLYTNLGIAQLRQVDNATSKEQIQNLLGNARDNFLSAIALEKNIPDTTPGWGIAHCYLASLPASENPTEPTINHERWCQSAQPQTLGDFAALAAIGKDTLQRRINESPALTPNPSVVLQGNQEFASEEDFYPPETITEPGRLEDLKLLLFAQIDDAWRTLPTFEDNLVYQVTVNEEGMIVSYEASDRLAEDFVQETPLPTLPKAEEDQGATAQFEVVFTPDGQLEVR